MSTTNLKSIENFHGIIVLEVFQDEWLDGLRYVFLRHLGDDGFQFGLGLDRTPSGLATIQALHVVSSILDVLVI